MLRFHIFGSGLSQKAADPKEIFLFASMYKCQDWKCDYCLYSHRLSMTNTVNTRVIESSNVIRGSETYRKSIKIMYYPITVFQMKSHICMHAKETPCRQLSMVNPAQSDPTVNAFRQDQHQ